MPTKTELENEVSKLTAINRALMHKASEDAKTMQRLLGDFSMVCQANNVVIVPAASQNQFIALQQSNAHKDAELLELQQTIALQNSEVTNLQQIIQKNSSVADLLPRIRSTLFMYSSMSLELVKAAKSDAQFVTTYPGLKVHVERSQKNLRHVAAKQRERNLANTDVASIANSGAASAPNISPPGTPISSFDDFFDNDELNLSFEELDTIFDEQPNRKKVKRLGPSNRNS